MRGYKKMDYDMSIKQPKTRRGKTTPRWPSSLKEKVRRLVEKPEADREGGAK